ncbi:hypothetical protein PCASD_12462, partial [Puccinia coronata f. sp. avenae]
TSASWDQWPRLLEWLHTRGYRPQVPGYPPHSSLAGADAQFGQNFRQVPAPAMGTRVQSAIFVYKQL